VDLHPDASGQVTSRAFVSSAFNDRIHPIDTSTLTVLPHISVSLTPGGVATSPDGRRVYVANQLANTVSMIDVSTGAVLGEVVVGASPRGIAVTPDGTKVYVANWGTTVAGPITVANSPRGIAVTDTRAFVTHGVENGSVTAIDTATNTVISNVSVGTTHLPASIAVTPTGQTVFVANRLAHNIKPIDATTLAVGAPIVGLEASAMSTQVTSTTGLPLIVERTMRWDQTGYGSHTEKATAGAATEWFFAEGSQGFFSTFFLLVNPQTTANVAHVTYLRENAAPIVRSYDLLASSRRTIDVRSEPELVNRSFGARMTFDRPGVAERAMYFGASPLFTGGHESAGVTAPATSWFLAEGATGSYFSTFVLLANPGAENAAVTLTYLPVSGDPIVRTHRVPAGQRVTVNIASEDAALASTAVATRVDSDRPIIVERAQYWPSPSWHEAHNSFGVTETATRWGLAEGHVGGDTADQTYILLANPGTTAATATLTFLRTNGTTIVKTFTVPATSRVNVAAAGAGSDVPELTNEAFGTVIESTQPIVVERSVYSNIGGVTWAAGSNATATRLP
jgi:YVTN family beta-propeller protein